VATEQVPILDFMLVRPPSEVEPQLAMRRYIRDTVLAKPHHGHADVDLQSEESPSAIGRLIYDKVFGNPDSRDAEPMADIREGVLSLLIARDPQSVNIAELEKRAYLRSGDVFYLLPDRLEYIPAPLSQAIAAAWPVLLDFSHQVLPATPPAAGPAATPAAGSSWEEKLADRVRAAFDGVSLAAIVFDGNGYADPFESTKRALFDALYILYVLRRWATVNFEHIMNGLRVLHTLEALAIDELYLAGRAGRLSTDGRATLAALSGDYPGFKGWTGSTALAGMPLVASPAALAELLDARPVVHPIFAQLLRYARPFNTIKPLGVGDLKVVKQWLVGYEAGEISDIHNVMLGETKERVHRRLEKTEETFSSSSSSQSETSTDTASTDRFEVKREAENVVKNDINVNANVRAQYDNKVVLVAVGAGFAYTRNTSDQQKLSQNFSREVVDKAVTRVQTQSASSRSVTKLFETEETNKHTFTNAPGTAHVSGIYRWVDKRYKAQVFNYGKRLMFEFVLPEPAAFLVESRLRNFEATMELPEEPQEPTYKTVQMDFQAADVTPELFATLRTKYDLAGVTMPPQKRMVSLTNRETGQAFFKEYGMDSDKRWWAKTYSCHIEADGYEVTKVLRAGDIYYAYSHDPNNVAWKERNLFNLSVNGYPLLKADYSNTAYIAFYRHNDDAAPDDGPFPLVGDDLELTLGFQNVKEYAMELSVELTIGAARWQAFQIAVYNAVRAIVQKSVDADNTERKLAYDTAMSTFRNRLADLKATAIHELLQGQSEAYNRDLVMTELRRQCLAMLTKEFDADAGDDLLTDWDTMGSRQMTVPYRQFQVNDKVSPVTAGFVSNNHEVEYPLPDLPQARGKGRYIQFLEQAFEWSRLGYICYPYFWATAPKWIELMNRTDDTDPNLTAFLRAGAIKVLVAVTPAYDDAVLHFLATREPWEGGPAPVIGDPLYLPIFEELHRAQDDRYGAKPDGDAWEFTLPTSLVYLHGSSTPLPAVVPHS
jgi:hypothetical protein